MVTLPSDVEDLLFTKHQLISKMRKGQVYIDHTTSTPSLARKIYDACKEKGVKALDIPVGGGDAMAKAGQVKAFCGGDEEAFQQIRPILQAYSIEQILFGGPGSGQSTKATMQILLASSLYGTCEGLIYAGRAGLNQQKVVEIIKDGAAKCYALSFYGLSLIHI
eukprot:TRINITY_DN12729_c0_g1_i1.p2 TRINITY_DN12729_c0_g1~~TRINITY_DN12729_c0_g1_i1.p2  ORF type:complete len:164 (-),score=23.25 TRINITY_DN12729_c0_g1_i1:58-549(-)